jgi:hypothetical protein
LNRQVALSSLSVALVFSLALFGGGLFSPNGLAPSAPAAVASAASIDPALRAAFSASGDGQARFVVILKDQADLSAADLIDDWQAKGRFVFDALTGTANRSQAALLDAYSRRSLAGEISYFQPYWIVNAIVVQGDRQAAEAIAAFAGVQAIVPEGKPVPPDPIEEGEEGQAGEAPEVVTWGVAKIRADLVWSTYGARGAGITAANIDTGVRYSHEALVRQYRGNTSGTPAGPFDHDYDWWDARSLASVPGSPSSFPVAAEGAHGTHVMGTEVGENATETEQIGVAPAANWIAAYGCCPNDEALLGAMQWMLAPTRIDGSEPDPDMRPHVVQNSWGGPGGYIYFNTAIGNLRAAGVFNSFSAGNSGSSCGTMGSPSDNLNSFSVGSTTSTDAISSFSSRGPNPLTGAVGPDLSAPGSTIRSSLSSSDTAYGNSSGTSMAGPHNAGAVALLWSLEPALIGKVAQTEALLRGTALPLTSAQTCGGVSGSQIPNNTFGWGRLDVKAAADMVYQAGVLRGVVTGNGSPLAGALVAITRNGQTIRQLTDANGAYSFTTGQGSYAMQVAVYGFEPGSASGVPVTQGNDTVQNFELTAKPVYQLSGQITSGGVLPVWGAQVTLKDQPVDAAISDAAGNYSLAVAEGSYTVQIAMAGFQTLEQVIAVNADTVQSFSLTPTVDYYALFSQSGPGCAVPYQWVELQGEPGVSTLALGDDASQTVAMGLTWPMYGVNYTSAVVSSNGFIQFGQNRPVPIGVIPFEGAPNNAVYGFTTDLNPQNGSQGLVYHKVVDGRWVVQFNQVQHWPNGNPETFQFLFDPASQSVTFQYKTVSNPGDTLVGIENSTGSVGTLVSKANWPPLVNGMAIKLTPFSGLAGAHNPADVNCDGVIDVVDITLLASVWGTVYGGSGYLLGYDLDQDGVIDIFDVQTAAGWWGWMGQ